MLRFPDSEGLLSVILDDGQTCQCPHRITCGYQNEAWCRYITKQTNNIEIIEYTDLSIAGCLYREQPGCCWVLDAVETLAENYLTHFKVDQIPVPAALIGAFDRSREIEIRTLPLRGCHGAVWLLGTEWVIQLNKNDTPQTRRHTLFHEAFHIACRNASPAFKRADLEYKPFRDLLADHFATCILMPKERIRKHWPEVHNVQQMARIFNVSFPAMQHRLEQLGLLRTHVIVVGDPSF